MAIWPRLKIAVSELFVADFLMFTITAKHNLSNSMYGAVSPKRNCVTNARIIEGQYEG